MSDTPERPLGPALPDDGPELHDGTSEVWVVVPHDAGGSCEIRKLAGGLRAIAHKVAGANTEYWCLKSGFRLNSDTTCDRRNLGFVFVGPRAAHATFSTFRDYCERRFPAGTPLEYMQHTIGATLTAQAVGGLADPCAADTPVQP